MVGGTQLISIRMAEALGERVALEAPVSRIEQGRDGVTVHADRLRARARRAIVALPPVLAGRVSYRPPMPARRDGLTQRMAQGSVVKCMAIYDEPFWRAAGLSGEVISIDGPVSVVFDNSPPDGSPGVLLAFLEGRAARVASGMNEGERREAVLGCLRRYFAGRPQRYLDRAWANEEFSRGCYGGFMPPGAWIENGPALREPVGLIHWAGAETAAVWNGYMEGAVRSGELAATAAAGVLRGSG